MISAKNLCTISTPQRNLSSLTLGIGGENSLLPQSKKMKTGVRTSPFKCLLLNQKNENRCSNIPVQMSVTECYRNDGLGDQAERRSDHFTTKFYLGYRQIVVGFASPTYVLLAGCRSFCRTMLDLYFPFVFQEFLTGSVVPTYLSRVSPKSVFPGVSPKSVGARASHKSVVQKYCV